jgi:hypothetical protein
MRVFIFIIAFFIEFDVVESFEANVLSRYGCRIQAIGGKNKAAGHRNFVSKAERDSHHRNINRKTDYLTLLH